MKILKILSLLTLKEIRQCIQGKIKVWPNDFFRLVNSLNRSQNLLSWTIEESPQKAFGRSWGYPPHHRPTVQGPAEQNNFKAASHCWLGSSHCALGGYPMFQSCGRRAVLAWWPSVWRAQVISLVSNFTLPSVRGRVQKLWRWGYCREHLLGQCLVEPWDRAVKGPWTSRATGPEGTQTHERYRVGFTCKALG